MSVVAQERACLDSVLQRYWYCTAHRLVGFGLPELGQDEEQGRNKAAVKGRQPIVARDLQASVHFEPNPRLGLMQRLELGLPPQVRPGLGPRLGSASRSQSRILLFPWPSGHQPWHTPSAQRTDD